MSQKNRKISETKRRRHRAYLEKSPPPRTGSKRCSRCSAVKPFNLDDLQDSGFGKIKRKNRSGTVTEYPRAYCKACDVKRQRAWREANREKHREIQRRIRKRKRKELRAYHREWSAQRRRKQGIPPKGGWHKYRDNGHGPVVEIPELVQLLDDLDMADAEVTRATGLDATGVRRARTRGRMTLEAADRLATAMGRPDLLAS